VLENEVLENKGYKILLVRGVIEERLPALTRSGA
jgi:hypothetical protein